MNAYLTSDGLLALIVLALALGQPAMAAWPQWRRWPETVPSRSAKLQAPVVPIDWAFSIWTVIFAGCIGFAIWRLLPGNVADPAMRPIASLAAILFAITILWEAYVPKRDLDWVSVLLIFGALAALLAILWRLEAMEPLTGARFWLLSAPFQLFAGWISAAVFVNLASSLMRAGVSFGTGPSLIFLVIAAAFGSAVAYSTGGLIYAAALAWAFFGIALANTRREKRPAVAALAGALIPVAPLSAYLGG